MTIDELYETVNELIDLGLVEKVFDARAGCVRVCVTRDGIAALGSPERTDSAELIEVMA